MSIRLTYDVDALHLNKDSSLLEGYEGTGFGANVSTINPPLSYAIDSPDDNVKTVIWNSATFDGAEHYPVSLLSAQPTTAHIQVPTNLQPISIKSP